MILVPPFYTLSSSTILFLKWVNQNCTQYSKCGLTINFYGITILAVFFLTPFLIIPSTEFVFPLNSKHIAKALTELSATISFAAGQIPTNLDVTLSYFPRYTSSYPYNELLLPLCSPFFQCGDMLWKHFFSQLMFPSS